MLGIFDDDPAFRIYDTHGDLVHPSDASTSKQMAGLSRAGVDLHLDGGEGVALVQFKAQRPEDSRGEFYHLEIQAEDPQAMADSIRQALNELGSADWETVQDGSLLSLVGEFPSLEEARMDELTARAIERVSQEEGVSFRVRSAKAGMQLAKRVSRNGDQPPSVTLTDNPNFTTDSGLILYPGSNGGARFANATDRRRVEGTEDEIREELEAEFEDKLTARLDQALEGLRDPERLQTIAELNILMHARSPDGNDTSETIRPVVDLLVRAEEISPRIHEELTAKGREALDQELRAHVGEADGYAWWWILAGFAVGIAVGIGLWWIWNALSWSVSVPLL